MNDVAKQRGMPSDELIEIYRSHREGQQKFTYLLLTLSTAAMAFAVQRTAGVSLHLSHTPLGMAVLVWGISFYCGCRSLLWVQGTMRSNVGLLQLQSGTHPEQPESPEEVRVAMQGVQIAISQLKQKAYSYAIKQYVCFGIGVVFFIIWHTLEMWRLADVAS